MAIIKADAYGHGMKECISALESLEDSPEYYGVAFVDEGIDIRKAGITNSEILSFAAFSKKEVDDYFQYSIYPTISSYYHLDLINRINLPGILKVHINIDTGMGWLGIKWNEAVEFIEAVSEMQELKIEGIYTHFATSDDPDKSFLNEQCSRFKNVVESAKAKGINTGIIHASNSGGIINLSDGFFDMVRPGLTLYGYTPDKSVNEDLDLKKVMQLKSKITTIQRLRKGDTVSYGSTFIAEKDSWAATVPLGYGDGIPRGLSNNFEVICGGKKFRQVGRVAMDRILIETGEIKLNVDDEVILIGKNEFLEITAWDWADKLNTIPYEITCGITKRVPRIFID